MMGKGGYGRGPPRHGHGPQFSGHDHPGALEVDPIPPRPGLEDVDSRTFIAQLFTPDDNAVPIIYPEFRPIGRLWVPLDYVYRTSGLVRYLNHQPHAPSLCMLFQKGRCNSHENCNQIHVAQWFAGMMRRALQATAVSSCCLVHGDPASNSNHTLGLPLQEVEVRRDPLPPLTIYTDRIAVTLFWMRFLKHKKRALFFNMDRVCNLHQQNACKYGVECKNVHLCRELWEKIVYRGYLEPQTPSVPIDHMARGMPRDMLHREVPSDLQRRPSPSRASHSMVPEPQTHLQPKLGRKKMTLEIVNPVSMEVVEVTPPQTVEAQSKFKEPEPPSHPPPTLSSDKEDILISFPMLAKGFEPEHKGPTWAGVNQLEESSPKSLSLGNLNECRAPGSPARAKSVSPVKDMFFNDMQIAGLSLGTFSNNTFEIGLVGPKDDDEFSSIADDLKSLQDEINDNNGEDQSGRLFIKIPKEGCTISEPCLSPFSQSNLPVSPASPFFMDRGKSSQISPSKTFSPFSPSSPMIAMSPPGTSPFADLELPRALTGKRTTSQPRMSPKSPLLDTETDWVSRAV